MTAHKAQGQTMNMVMVDLAGCSGTEQPYVMVSGSTSLQGLIVLREFDFSIIAKRRSEDLRKEFSHLEELRLRTSEKFGLGGHQDIMDHGPMNKRKRGVKEASGKRKKSRV